MALETLKDIKKIGEFKIFRAEIECTSSEIPIVIYDEYNTIAFRLQDGPVKENGHNGCQVDTIIQAARLILQGLNEKFPCRENAIAITKLDEAEMWLERRKQNRIERRVEGTSQL